jgi:hypothetical protein
MTKKKDKQTRNSAKVPAPSAAARPATKSEPAA